MIYATDQMATEQRKTPDKTIDIKLKEPTVMLALQLESSQVSFICIAPIHTRVTLFLSNSLSHSEVSYQIMGCLCLH